eukprot:4045027-Pyramimonas_sp.AAC.1
MDGAADEALATPQLASTLRGCPGQQQERAYLQREVQEQDKETPTIHRNGRHRLSALVLGVRPSHQRPCQHHWGGQPDM